MSKILRGLGAGIGAKMLGGGIISTLIVFVILWWVLGHFGIFQVINGAATSSILGG